MDPERRPILHRNHSRRPARLQPRSVTYQTSSRSRQQQQQAQAPRSPAPSNVNPHNLRRTRAACAAILLSLIFERVAFYGLAGNLVLFLNKQPLAWHSYNAINASLFFFGVSFVMSLVGGWLADAFLGRFKAIAMSLVIYIGGFLLMPLMSEDSHKNSPLLQLCWDNGTGTATPTAGSGDDDSMNAFEETCSWLVFLALTVVAIGAGFVKANIAPFGSDQVSGEGQQATLSFFHWFYWSVNLGALLGLSLLAYLEQQWSFFTGYTASVACLAASLLIFLAGRCFYHVREPDGSVLTNIVRILREAHRRRREARQRLPHPPHEVDCASSVEVSLSFLDYAKHRHGGVFHDALVEDVKELKKIFAVFAVLIPYWLVYFQMQTSFLVQGLHMRLSRVSSYRTLNTSQLHSIPPNVSTIQPLIPVNQQPQVVAAWLSLFDVVALILLLPLFDRVIYPWLERRRGARPISISHRMVLGMGFAAGAMVTAGVVEHFRLEVFWNFNDTTCVDASIVQIIDNTQYYAADMSILWQIPQYVLIGLSELFTSVAGLQFAVSIAPRSMKGLIMGLFYLFSGMGSFLGTAVVAGLSAGNVWFLSPDSGNINCRWQCMPERDRVDRSCHLDYYFYLLAALEVLGACLFLLVSRVFQLDEHHRRQRRISCHHWMDASREITDDARRAQIAANGQRRETIQRSLSEDAGD